MDKMSHMSHTNLSELYPHELISIIRKQEIELDRKNDEVISKESIIQDLLKEIRSLTVRLAGKSAKSKKDNTVIFLRDHTCDADVPDMNEEGDK